MSIITVSGFLRACEEDAEVDLDEGSDKPAVGGLVGAGGLDSGGMMWL